MIVLSACGGLAGEQPASPGISDGAGDASATDVQAEPPEGDGDSSTTDAEIAPEVGPWDANQLCSWPYLDHAEGCVLENGANLATPLVATVNVTQVEHVAPGVCRLGSARAGSRAGAELGLRLVLETTDGRVLSLTFRAPELPANLVRVGDTLRFSLSIYGSTASFFGIGQTFTLARDGRVVLFAAILNGGHTAVPFPDLGVDDVQFADEGPLCVTSEFLKCESVQHRIRITVGADTISAIPFQSGRLGPLTFAVDSFFRRYGGACDLPSSTEVAGYFAPQLR